MNTISRKVIRDWWLVACLLLALMACDFNGPWSYYPEEREIYTGIYTYGYIIEGETPYVCFSKVYRLDETSAENFAFYDSAYVEVEHIKTTEDGNYSVYDSQRLSSSSKKPNCFETENSFVGEAGEQYRMRAFFKWDSVGHMVETEYTAMATIPTGFGLKGVNVPLKGGKYEWREVDLSDYKADGAEENRFEVDYLEFPDDVNLYKFALEYNDDIGGVLAYIEYDIKNGGENMNTTINYMLGDFLEKDSCGYTGVSIRDALESHNGMGFEENQRVAGLNMLDTIFAPNMTFSLGKNNIHFLATEAAYAKYRRYALGALEDPRILPESNIENGMGVFSGMTHIVLPMELHGDGVAYPYIAVVNCINSDWKEKTCRLYQDIYCSGAYEDFDGLDGELYELNKDAPYYFSRTDYKASENDFCYAPAIKAAMMLDTSSWSVFLPENVSQKDKDKAYGDALKRYCVANNFKSVKIADCSTMEEDCLENFEKTDCKEYLWEWCADRNWDFEKFPQCESGFVSRYYLENQKSSILKREVDYICNNQPVGETLKQCERE